MEINILLNKSIYIIIKKEVAIRITPLIIKTDTLPKHKNAISPKVLQKILQ
jgi:hypothetical protein